MIFFSFWYPVEVSQPSDLARYGDTSTLSPWKSSVKKGEEELKGQRGGQQPVASLEPFCGGREPLPEPSASPGLCTGLFTYAVAMTQLSLSCVSEEETHTDLPQAGSDFCKFVLVNSKVVALNMMP